MSQPKRKFSDGDLVLDSSAGLVGRISGYFGQGVYSLDQLRAPIYNSCEHLINYVEVRIEDPCHWLDVPDKLLERGGESLYVQTSRFLTMLSQVDAEQIENQLTRLEGFWFFDKWSGVLKVTDMKLVYRGNRCPFQYTLELSFTDAYEMIGTIRNHEIKSVRKINIDGTPGITNIRPSDIFTITDDEAKFVVDWETTYAPFTIQGNIL